MRERAIVEGEVREWIFTFGFGQEHDGVAMKNKFVRIRGTFDEARLEMIRRYGKKWAFQYASEDEAGVVRYNLEDVT